ncbi:MAG: hypothetical protein HGB15_03415 [Chlorobaculum sp.]|nr:hypothetical protein [Chlorobaculum sp.]
MTAVIFNISPEQVIIATDTLAMTGDTRTPYFFTTKFYPLPHLNGVMFATGIGDLATKWFVSLERFLARDIHHLDQYVTSSLQKLGHEFMLSENRTTTVYHVEFSEMESQYVGFAYRSTNSFKSERLAYGLRTKPGIPKADIKSYPDDFILLMEQQRAEDNRLPFGERAFIGGEIQMLIMQEKNMIIRTVHRFSDYETLYNQMCDELPANK